MYFAFFDQQGRVETAHNDDAVSLIPVGAVELTKSQFEGRFDLRLVGGVLSFDPLPSPPPVVPRSVTMRQARLALLQTGKLDVVNSAIAGMPGDAGAAARIEWEFSSTVERDRGHVKQIAIGLGMTDKQLDDLFILAATL